MAAAGAAVLLTAGCTGSNEDDVDSSGEAVRSTASGSSAGASASSRPESTDAESKSAPVGVTLEALKLGADVSDIFDAFPTNSDAADRAEYSPAWDLNVGVYSDAGVAAGRNGLQTDSDEIRQLAAAGVVGSPGRLPLGSANIVINCPALALLDKPVER